MQEKELTWKEVRKRLNITNEEEQEIELEKEIIKATIEVRKQLKLSQRDLSKRTGIKQPAIARIEKNVCSPKVSTLIKILCSMGYTIKIVPLEKEKR